MHLLTFSRQQVVQSVLWESSSPILPTRRLKICSQPSEHGAAPRATASSLSFQIPKDCISLVIVG